MPGKLLPLDLAAHVAGHPASTIRRWAAEGRLTRHPDRMRRKNGVLYDFNELPIAERDPDTLELIQPGATPPVIEHGQLAA
ncbi:DNA-binding protein [Streptomyces sp. B21-083]|uniref:DNA-binding protein n=1 Tax=Streptomyces sp. B21-083 TaxID=3039410 RepID=UPI002FF42BD6